MSKKPIDKAKTPLRELERDLKHSAYFTHRALEKQSKRINEVESFLYGLIDVLILNDSIDPDSFKQEVQKVRNELLEKQEQFHPNIALRVDSENPAVENNTVNCAERIHICKAVCCKLHFALSANEIELAKVKWELGKPYFNKKNSAGYCTHLHSKKLCCTVYEERPRICKQYSCKNDKRIWKNFKKMELNDKWIDENLSTTNAKSTYPKMITQ